MRFGRLMAIVALWALAGCGGSDPSPAECGNGDREIGEECDDGGIASCDGCSAACAIEACGNSVVDCGETCDDGNVTAGDGCSSACVLEVCGDGVVQPGLGEECDDGNNASGDGCSATCLSEAGECTPDYTLVCSVVDSWDNGGAGSTDVVDEYSCTYWSETGPEYAYAYEATESRNVTATLSNMLVDLDVFVLSDPAGAGVCAAANCLAFGDSAATWPAVAGERYFIVVDGFLGAAGSYSLSFSCP